MPKGIFIHEYRLTRQRRLISNRFVLNAFKSSRRLNTVWFDDFSTKFSSLSEPMHFLQWLFVSSFYFCLKNNRLTEHSNSIYHKINRFLSIVWAMDIALSLCIYFVQLFAIQNHEFWSIFSSRRWWQPGWSQIE